MSGMTTVTTAPRASTRPPLRPALRKSLLALHLVASIGWMGSDLGLLVLGWVGMRTSDPGLRRAAYLVLAPLGTWLAVPLSLLALVTGILLGLGTRWGLFRYLWVVVSLVMTLAMVVLVLLVLNPSLHSAAHDAARSAGGTPDATARRQLIVAPTMAFLLLSTVTVINVFKPWGRLRRSNSA
jgi:uncharacterized membrane protein